MPPLTVRIDLDLRTLSEQTIEYHGLLAASTLPEDFVLALVQDFHGAMLMRLATELSAAGERLEEAYGA